ncbi:MAG: hypothetical protein ACOYVK_15445 [Bacillota bacterium]
MEGNNEHQISTVVKSQNPLSNIFSNIMSNQMILPFFLFMLMSKGAGSINSEELFRYGEMLRTVQPYFKDKPNETLGKTENVLDIMHAFNRLTKGEYKEAKNYRSYADVPDKHIRILENIRPYMKGKSRDSIEKVLTLNDRVNRLRNRMGKKSFIEDFEDLTDILEILKRDKGYEVRSMLDKVKEMMDILGR